MLLEKPLVDDVTVHITTGTSLLLQVNSTASEGHDPVIFSSRP